jgi:hypothetical protein
MSAPIHRMTQSLAVLSLAVLALAGPVRAQTSVSVVDMIPWTMSSETNNDREPSVTVNPASPKQIAATAFTPDPMGGPLAPIFVSTDGGLTWYINSIVPANAQSETADITPRFSGSGNRLYVGIIQSLGFMKILRTDNYLSSNAMTKLVERDNDDQPWVAAATVIGPKANGKDRVWVGNNQPYAPAGHTATIDLSLDGAAAMPPSPSNFTPLPLETRGNDGADYAPVRISAHADGTVYAIYYAVRGPDLEPENQTVDAVVVRDDNWGASAAPFSALKEPGDTNAGLRLAKDIVVPNNPNAPSLGSERLGGGGITIAVDPLDSDRVYAAYSDYPNGQKPYTLHVLRSEDRGKSWTALLNVKNVINPSLAVTVQGMVGLMYQQFTDDKQWETHVLRSIWPSKGAGWFDIVLAKFADGAFFSLDLPYLGDYAHMQASGNELIGVFSSANYPDLAHFPSGFSFVRKWDQATHTLKDTTGKSTVPISIDPFFFRLGNQYTGDDFWVRDWTDSPASGDDGTEPSTHADFTSTSDVWNRKSNAPGAFPNDQPDNEAPANPGDNWLFARIRRKYTSSISQTVKARFLVARYGIGSPFGFVSLFPDATVTFATNETGPKTTPALPWHLDAKGSTKVSLAVEITGPRDYPAGSLNGVSAGWPGGDIRVVTDNNRAQRNTYLPLKVAGSGMVKIFALLHNAATFPRDMVLRCSLSDPRRLDGATARVTASSLGPLRAADPWPLGGESPLTVPAMQPAEDRWLEIALPAAAGEEGEELSVSCEDVAADRMLDRFTAGVRLASMEKTAADLLSRHFAVHARLAATDGIAEAEEESRAAQEALDAGLFSEEGYRRFLGDNLKLMASALDQLRTDGDPFAAREQLDSLARLFDGGAAAADLTAAHATYLEALDELLTLRQLAQGDPAALLQTVRWQRDLFLRAGRLAALPEAEALAGASRSFVSGYQEERLTSADYPGFLREVSDTLRKVAGELETVLPDLIVREKGIEEAVAAGDLTAMQKAHRDFLVQLQTLDKGL